MGLYEDWRNKKLQEAIDAGINPFLEFDISSLPAKGTAYETIFPTGKVYGNIVDGIPISDLKAKADGTVIYKTDELSNLTTVNSLLGTIDADTSLINTWGQGILHESMLNMPHHYGINTTHGFSAAEATNCYIEEHTLVGGALANAVLYQPGAGYAALMFKMLIGVDTAALLNQNYDFHIQDEDDVDIFFFNWSPATGHDWINIPYLHGTDDKDIEIDIANGAGAEHLRTITVCGRV